MLSLASLSRILSATVPSAKKTMSDSKVEDVASLHHPTYYFKDEIVFLVENRYFKVPRIRLEQNSAVLKQRFEDVDSEYGFPGKSDDRPIVLEDVSSEDFTRLLSFLYPLTNDYDTFTNSWNHHYWMSILRLASKYKMSGIQAKAITKLTYLNNFKTAVHKIKCGEEYGHTAWIRDGYKELIKRQEPLLVEEGKSIGLESAILCAAAREKYHDRVPRSGSAYYTAKTQILDSRGHYTYNTLPVPTLADSELDNILYDHFPHLKVASKLGPTELAVTQPVTQSELALRLHNLSSRPVG